MKTLGKIGVVFYVIGLVILPLYKAFIEPNGCFESITSFLSSAAKFILYIIGWWFLYTPICWLILSAFVLKGEDAKDMRYGCVYPSLVIALLVCYLTVFHDNKKNKDNSKSGVYSSKDAPSQAMDSVYVCMGSGAYAFHVRKSCRGLNNCDFMIKRISIEKAEKMGRKPCGICSKYTFKKRK